MESWNYISEGRGMYLSEEFDFRHDNHVYNKSKLMGLCESKPFLNVENYPQVLEKSDFVEMGFCDKISNEASIKFGNVGEEKVCGSKIGSTDSDCIRSNNEGLPVVDLKVDSLEGELRESNVFKRSRSTSSYLESSKCQVLGCNKDLGCYKGYYKRHKVCKEHTRTVVVIVNGLKQRFCQQCSRFHQVAEFDDDKRSCRKRLAVHNNRRRKPRFPSDETGTGIINFSSSYTFSESLPTPTPTATDLNNVLELKRAEQVKIEERIESSKHSVTSMSTSTILNSFNILQTNCALSLLSAQPHNVTKDAVQNLFHETEIHPKEAESNLIDPRLLCGDILKESDVRNNTSLGHGIILDLQQLSTRLHRIQQKKLSTESDGI